MSHQPAVLVDHHHRTQTAAALGTRHVSVDRAAGTSELHHLRGQSGIIRIDNIIDCLSHKILLQYFYALSYNEIFRSIPAPKLPQPGENLFAQTTGGAAGAPPGSANLLDYAKA